MQGKVDGSGTKTQYVYGETGNGQKAGLIYGVKIDDQNTLSYTYDELARTSTRTLDLGTDFTTSYEYLDGNTLGSTTTLVSKMTNGNVSWIYTYDSRGNIETISKQQGSGQPVQQVKYYYDELNQLVREDSVVQNKTITYSYDTGGNITSRKEYAYTTGDLGNPTATISYSYGDSNWKDKLTKYGNNPTITYDEIGNPLYYNGKHLTWQNGRQLATLGTNGLSVSYTYDDSGIRTSKTVNGTKTQYYLNGSTILTQITGDNRFDFFYDENGLLLGFSYNGAKYYYIRNLQSDIIGILDNSGNQVVSYTYDSWGKLLSIDGSAKDTIGVQNPFRYRGYYYDTETGFYYLNSRYYDPMVGRFLNADGLIDSRGHVTQNLFQYCGNNFVNYIDSSGNFAIEIASGIFLGGALLAMYVAQYAPQLSELVNNIIVGIAEATDELITTLTRIFSNTNEDDDSKDVAASTTSGNKKEGTIYYHVTTPENAFRIQTSNKLIGSNWEGGYVYAWRFLPNKSAIRASGAHYDNYVILAFRTNASFAPDNGIKNRVARQFQPVVSTRPGPISIWDVVAVGGG